MISYWFCNKEVRSHCSSIIQWAVTILELPIITLKQSAVCSQNYQETGVFKVTMKNI